MWRLSSGNFSCIIILKVSFLLLFSLFFLISLSKILISQMLALVPVIYWYTTNHLRAEELKTIAIIYFAHKSVIQAGFQGDGSISAFCGITTASAMGLEDLLPRWLSHRAGKLVVAVNGSLGTFPHGILDRVAWASFVYGGWVLE